MARPFQQLRDGIPAPRRERAEHRARAALAEMALQELRKSLQISQEELATELGITQASLSKLERRTDVYVSSIRKLIAAMGGELVILASFPGGDVRLTQFAELHDEKPPVRRQRRAG